MYEGGDIKTYTQGEYTFSIRQFPPFYAMKVLGELQKVIAPLLDGAVSGVSSPAVKDDSRSDLAVLATVASGSFIQLSQHISGEEFEHIAHLLLDPEYVYVKGKVYKSTTKLTEDIVNDVFSGRAIDMIVLMVKVVTANFMDFGKLCSIPSGVREMWDGLMSTSLDELTKLSNQKSSSGGPSKKE